MSTGEKFKAVMLSNSKLRSRLDERINSAKASIKAASLQISAIPVGNTERQGLERELQVFADEVDAQVNAGVNRPGDAWVAMKDIGERVAVGAKDIKVRAVEKAQGVTNKVTALTKTIALDHKTIDVRVSRGELSADAARTYRGELDGIEGDLQNAVTAGGNRDALDLCQTKLLVLKTSYALPSDTANVTLNQKVQEVRDVLVEARKARRNVADDQKAVALAVVIQEIEQGLDDIVADADSAAEATNAIAAEELLAKATAALEQATRDGSKVGGKTDAGTASKATVQALLAIPALAEHLNSTTPDPQGRTPLDHVKAVLTTFDDKFALSSSDAKEDTELNRQGVAMRVAAVVGAAAREIARGLHDPALQPLIAKSLLQEYESEMTTALRDKKLIEGEDAADNEEQAAVKRAITLAQAMVMDDPMTKLLTGKITFADAVQRIRDMAAFAKKEGALELPSEMLKLLRQQFEMTIGSYSADELTAGKAKADVNQGGTTFPLENVPGELNPEKILGTDAEPTSGLIKQELHTRGNRDEKKAPHEIIDGPTWGTTGLDFNDEAKTLLENLEQAVAAWDTPDPVEKVEFEKAFERLESQLQEVRAVPQEQQLEALRAITPKLLEKAAQNLHKPDDPAFLAGKKMYANPKAEAGDRELLARDDVPRYIPVPGLGQDHQLDAALDDPNAAARAKFVKEYEQISRKMDDLGTPVDGSSEARKLAKLTGELDLVVAKLKELGDKDKAARHGAINQRQYEHLRMLARADAEEQETFQAEKGQSVKEWVLGEIAGRYDVNTRGAEGLLAAVAEWMKTVPLTITFNASSLFSSPDKNEPTYGSVYTSEVVHSRGQKDLKELIGRDDNIRPDDKHAATLGVTGGKDKNPAQVKIAETLVVCEENAKKIQPGSTGADYAVDFWPGLQQLTAAIEACAGKDDPWLPIFKGLGNVQPKTLASGDAVNAHVKSVMESVAKFKAKLSTDAAWVVDRGRNYMRWRTDKDDREARLDHLAPEDQQIFGAANPNFDELKGGAAGKSEVGVNYYGDCHFLLSDSVRSRSAFVMRGVGAVNPVQRMDILMLIYDMLKGGDATKAYLDTVLLHAKKKDFAIATGLDWEVHLYGGFDITKDAQAIYLPSDLDEAVRTRIGKFAKANGVACESYNKIPPGLNVLSSANPTSFELDA